MLIDTDVLIWAARGHAGAIKALDGVSNPQLSVVTQIELMQGARNKAELQQLEERLQKWGPPILHLDSGISALAVELIRDYSHAHELQLADALIAATALAHGLALFSGNRKHYQNVAGLDLENFMA